MEHTTNRTQAIETKSYLLKIPDSPKLDAEHFELMDELGLNKNTIEEMDSNSSNQIPFVKMGASEQNVWKEYCPTQGKIEDYDGFIPLECLKDIREAKKYFDFTEEKPEEEIEGASFSKGYIQIWEEAKEVIDPIAVGVIETSKKYNWGWGSPERKYYLLSQWGESLKDFKEIYDITLDKCTRRITSELSKKQKEVARKLDTVKEDVQEYIDGGREVSTYV